MKVDVHLTFEVDDAEEWLWVQEHLAAAAPDTLDIEGLPEGWQE